MQDNNSLDDLLSGSADDQPQPHAQPEATPERVEARPEPTGDKQQDAASPAEVEEVTPESGFVPVKAVQEERRKRQDLEKRLKEYEAKLQQQPQPQQEQYQQPDWFASPEQAAQAMQMQFEQQLFQRSVAMSEIVMREKHTDYDEVSNLFAERAKQDPQLLQRLYQHPFPAQFAYQVGQQIRLMEEIGSDPAAYRAKVEAEIRASLGQPERQGQRSTSQAPASSPAVPRSLARDVSQQPRNSAGRFDGPAPIEDLLG